MDKIISLNRADLFKVERYGDPRTETQTVRWEVSNRFGAKIDIFFQ